MASSTTDDIHQQGHRHIEGSSSADSSAIKYDDDGKFLVSLQVALYNPFVQQRGLFQSHSQSIEDAYTVYYSTIMRNSIAYLFCTAVQDVLFVNVNNQNVCPELIAATGEITVYVNDDDSVQDTVSIDNDNNNSNNSSTPSVTPTLLDEVPYQLRVIHQNVTIGNTSDYANDVFAFTIWYIDYTIIQIGSVYIEEAIIQTGNSDVVWNRSSTVDSVLDITDVSIEAVKAMNVVLQLTLDVNTMDTTDSTGTGSYAYDNGERSSFDTLIQTIRNSSLTTTNTTVDNGDTMDTDTNPYDRQLRLYLCSSPVVVDDVNLDQNNNIMIQKFTAAYEEFQNGISETYRSSSTLLSPMRIGGIVLLTVTIATYVLLLYLSASRRRRRLKGGVSQPQHRVPQEQAIMPQSAATITTATPTAAKKTPSNRMLAVPPSVPSSRIVQLARGDAR